MPERIINHRVILHAAIKAAYPHALDADIAEFFDVLGGEQLPSTALAADIAATVPGVVTGDELPRLVGDGIAATVPAAAKPHNEDGTRPAKQKTSVSQFSPAAEVDVESQGDELPRLTGDGVSHVQVEEPAGDVLPPLDAGCEIVTVVRFFDKTWPDSGRVRTLLLSRADGSELKAKFDESRAATWKAACSALGCQYEDSWREIQGSEAVCEIVDWTAKDGTTKPIVRRWVARPGSPRAVEKAAEAAAKAERAAKRSRNAQPQHSADDQDVPF